MKAIRRWFGEQLGALVVLLVLSSLFWLMPIFFLICEGPNTPPSP